MPEKLQLLLTLKTEAVSLGSAVAKPFAAMTLWRGCMRFVLYAPLVLGTCTLLILYAPSVLCAGMLLIALYALCSCGFW